ncbi:hypothetical protein TKK_0018441 [Trichogramma kaykai]|uniref:Uncharacterized protein n=1 Tax=Trichogramma kaykai TaxID=54128 RepID=A0ABD2VYG6_9HYME
MPIRRTQSMSHQLTATAENKDRVVLVYGDRIEVRSKDLKKRGSHACDMQALRPLPIPVSNSSMMGQATTATTTMAGTTSQDGASSAGQGQQQQLQPVSVTVTESA